MSAIAPTPGQSAPCPKCANCPTDCPARTDKMCPLRTISASQIASALALLIALFIFAVNAPPSGGDRTFALQSLLLVVVIVMYYYLVTWRLEEEHHATLRGLKGGSARLEFFVRVVILATLGVASTLLAGILPSVLGLTQLESGLVFLAAVFLAFLVWDAVVMWGDNGDGKASGLAGKFFMTDVVGAVLVLLCLWSLRFNHENVRAMSVLGAAVFVGFLQWSDLSVLRKRMADRAQLR
jgi:hypothetical protein